jgi:hypothetical protein
LYRLFVHTNHRFLLIIGAVIHFKYILHISHKGGILFRRYTPAFLQMRFIRFIRFFLYLVVIYKV